MISVVIPTLDAARGLGPTLGALGEGLSAGLVADLVIADGGSSDDIEEIAEEVGATFIAAPRGRGVQLAAGAEAARKPWILFLHADSVLSPGWPGAAIAHLEAGPERAGYFRLAFDASGAAPALVAGWANLRSRLFALPYGDQGLLIHKTLYDRVGGYPPVPLMEDVALVHALGRRRLAPIGATVVTSAARYRRDGWLRRGAWNLTTYARWRAGVAPERLIRYYQR